MAYADIGLASGYILRLTVDVIGQSIAANTTTYAYSLVIHKGSGSGKWAQGPHYWSVATPSGNYINSGSISSYDFRNYSALTLVSGSIAIAGSAARQWAGGYSESQWGELGAGTASLVLTPPSIPLTPTGLTVARVADAQQTLSWTRASTYTGVVVQRRTDGGAWQEIGRPAGNVATFTDTTTAADHRYDYRVAGLAGAGQSGFSNEASIFTSPAAPTGVTATRSGNDIVVSASELPRHATGYDVEDAGSIVKTGAVLPWTHAAPAAATPHTYRVRGVVAGIAGAWSAVSNTVQLITQPNPPVNLSPNGGVVPVGASFRLSWTHNPVDSSAQTAYQLRYRSYVPGGPAGSWTTLTGTTASFRDVTLPVSDFEWQVCTKGAHASYSTWSAIATITVIDRPGAAVTQPGPEWDASILTMTWSYLQAQGRPQSAWEAELIDETSTVVETRSGSGDGAEVTFATRLHQGEWTVRARAVAGTVWSGWAVQAFTVVFDPPAAPEITGSWDEPTGSVSLSIAPGVSAGAPATARLLLERSIDDGESWEAVVSREQPELMHLADRESLSYGVTRYRLTAFTIEGATSEAILEVAAQSLAVWLSGGVGFGLSGRLPFNPKVTLSAGRARALKRYAGRPLPVAYSGEALTRTVQVDGAIADHALSGEESVNIDRLTELAQVGSPIFLLRDPDGRRIYGSIGSIQMPRETATPHEGGWNGIWGYSFTLEEAGRS